VGPTVGGRLRPGSSPQRDENPGIPYLSFVLKNITVHFIVIHTFPRPTLRAAVQDIAEALGYGARSPVVSEVTPDSELTRAHETVFKFRGTGKIVLLAPAI